MIYADLHAHTAYSDGVLPIKEVLDLAKSKGIKVLAITDHDTTSHFEEIEIAAREVGIRVIRGVEMSCYDFEVNKKVHVLALFLGSHIPTIEALCNNTLKCRNAYHKELIDTLNSKGYDITFEDAQKHSKYSGIVFKMNIFQALKEKYKEEMTKEKYSELFQGTTSVEVDRKMGYIPVEEGIQAILKDGGIPVLAHPVVYDNYSEIEKYVTYGLKGIEINHSRMKEKDFSLTDAYATRFNLMRSGGSDFHDPEIIQFGDYGLSQEQFDTFEVKASEFIKENSTK